MPQFNVGDRVRCVRPGGGGIERAELGEVYVVSGVMLNGALITLEGMHEVFSPNRFTLEPEHPKLVTEQYALVYTTNMDLANGIVDRIFVATYSTLGEAEDEEQWFEQNGFQVLSRKKLKLSYNPPKLPEPQVFQDVQLDEFDQPLDEDEGIL